MIKAALAVARGHELRADYQREDEAGTGGLNIERRAVELEPILHQVGRGGEGHIWSESGQDEQVHIGRIAIGGLETAKRRLDAEVAGRLMG